MPLEPAMSDARPPRHRSLVALGCGALALVVWLANLLEVTLFRPHVCSLARMQFESYLLLARAPALLLPLVGLVLAALSRSDSPRLRAVALLVCSVLALVTLALLLRWLPAAALHLPCLRD